MALANGFFFGYKTLMRFLNSLLLLLLCSSALAEEKVWVGGQQITQEELDAALEPLLEAYWYEISSPQFVNELRQSSDWRQRMVNSLLQRYPEGPRGDNSAGRNNPDFERSLNDVIQSAPAELAPRVLMLLHCGEALLESSHACIHRHAKALNREHPNNALGPLFLAQAALDRGDSEESAAWMEQAALRDVVKHGGWAIVKALFEVFANAEPLVDDPLNLGEVAKEMLAEGMIAHLIEHPFHVLGRQCQRAGDEPLMTGCLAVAKAMKLPGTGRLAYNMALAIEERIFERRNDHEKLSALKLERQSLKSRFKKVSAVQNKMFRDGIVAPVLEAYVKFGELDTAIDFAATAARMEAPGKRAELVLKASTSERVRCLDIPKPPEAPDCVTPDMVKAEVERLTDVLDERMQAEDFRRSLEADQSAEAQILALYVGLPRVDAQSPQRLATAKTLMKRFPEHALANRLAASLCHRERQCLSEAADHLMTQEMDDALGYLLSAVVHFENGEEAEALAVLEKATQANKLHGGFGSLAATGAEVIARHMGPAPASDVLGVWELTPGMVSIGYAAALSLPAARLSRNCQGNLEKAMYSGCLQAARALQLPGGSLIELMMGLQLETRIMQAADAPGLDDAIDRLARVEQLRDKMVESLDQFSSDPTFHYDYLSIIGKKGEVAALKWMLTREKPEDA